MSNKKRKKKIEFSLHLGIYDYVVNFIVTKDREELNTYVRNQFDDKYFDIDFFNRDGLKSIGNVIYRDKYSPIVWMPRKPVAPREYGTLAHELLHVTCRVMRWAEIPLTEESEEAYTHLLSCLMTNFLENVKK